MAITPTQNDIALITPVGWVMYYGNVNFGIIRPDGVTFNQSAPVEKESGGPDGNTAIAYNRAGFGEVSATVTLPSGLEQKNLMLSLNPDIFSDGAGGQATSRADGAAGSLYGQSYVGQATELPLVLYPIWTDTKGEFGVAGTQYIDNASNPFAKLYRKAVHNGELERVMGSSGAVENVEVTFLSVADYDNDGQILPIISSGIEPDGTFTAPV